MGSGDGCGMGGLQVSRSQELFLKQASPCQGSLHTIRRHDTFADLSLLGPNKCKSLTWTAESRVYEYMYICKHADCSHAVYGNAFLNSSSRPSYAWIIFVLLCVKKYQQCPSGVLHPSLRVTVRVPPHPPPPFY